MHKTMIESTAVSKTRKALKAKLIQAVSSVVEALSPDQLERLGASRHRRSGINVKAVSRETRHGLTIEIFDEPSSGASSGNGLSLSSLTSEALDGKPLQRIETEAQQHALDTALSRAAQRADALISEIMKQPEMLSSDEMAHRLGVTRDTVNRRREAGRLLALSGAKRGFRYPAWQLDQHGKPVVGLERVLTAAGDAWSAYRWLTATHPELDNRSGLEALRKGQEHDLLALIEHRGETFA
jgi:hypothetical protein